ncbi:MAG: chemotaxis protein CheC [Candidatus Omnitrophica bacterium]|nr:chemotaxis protein CheC [Candidatus Omnitrophota bacterium]
MKEIILSDTQKDAIREIGNICAGNAATAFSQLLNRKIEIIVPNIFFIPIENVTLVIDGKDKLVAGIVVRLLGDLPGYILFVFPQKDALILSSFMTGRTISNGSVIGDLERSALKETGIILANAYINALSSFIEMGLVPAVPEVIVDMAGAMVDYILIELSCESQFALVIESEFREVLVSIKGHFFLIPNPAGLEIILKAISKF